MQYSTRMDDIMSSNASAAIFVLWIERYDENVFVLSGCFFFFIDFYAFIKLIVTALMSSPVV